MPDELDFTEIQNSGTSEQGLEGMNVKLNREKWTRITFCSKNSVRKLCHSDEILSLVIVIGSIIDTKTSTDLIQVRRKWYAQF